MNEVCKGLKSTKSHKIQKFKRKYTITYVLYSVGHKNRYTVIYFLKFKVSKYYKIYFTIYDSKQKFAKLF